MSTIGPELSEGIADNISAGTLDILLTHVEDRKWREIFLLTASLLPNATTFLAAFETVLQGRLARRPQLIVWLQWIAKQALLSRPGYRQLAARAWYASALMNDLALVSSRTFDSDLAGSRARQRHR